jgi:protein-S-isoprenylcysteine O-methyltransferase Ste14
VNKSADSANVRFPPPLIYLGFLVAGIVIGRALALPGFGLGSTVATAFGWGLVLVGLVVNFSSAGMFRRSGTAIIPFKPASRLVTSGIYRWTRNPMYLGMALLYAGIAVLFESILALILLTVVIAIIDSQVIAREEAYLGRQFGDEYRAYKARVRRWI